MSVSEAVASVMIDTTDTEQGRGGATLASPLCRFRDFLGVSSADRMLGQIAVHGVEGLSGLDGCDGPASKGLADLAAVVSDLGGVVCDLLGVELPARPRLVFELVAGDDRGRLSTDSRADLPRVGFVYWLHARPRRFRGGQLRIYDVGFRSERPAVDAEYRDCPVEHDTVVFFPASSPSELRPVTRPAELQPVNAAPGDPGGSRFAVRGWIS